MPGTITVNLQDPELASAFADAKPGDTLTLDSVTLTVGAKDDQSLQGDIDELEYDGASYGYSESEEAEPENEPPDPKGMAKMPMAKGMMSEKMGKGMPTTIIAIGAGKPRR